MKSKVVTVTSIVGWPGVRSILQDGVTIAEGFLKPLDCGLNVMALTTVEHLTIQGTVQALYDKGNGHDSLKIIIASGGATTLM